MGTTESQPLTKPPPEADLSGPYITTNRRHILGVRRQHFVLYRLLSLAEAPRELARAIVLCLYQHEMKCIVDDAFVHGWTVRESIGGYYRYLSAPTSFACSGWAHMNAVEFQHPCHGWLILDNLVIDERLRRTGDRDPPVEKINPNNVVVGSAALFFI